MYIECMYAFCDAVLASPNRRTWHAPLIIPTVVVAILFWKMTCTWQRKMMYWDFFPCARTVQAPLLSRVDHTRPNRFGFFFYKSVKMNSAGQGPRATMVSNCKLIAPCMSSDPLTSFSWALFMCRPRLVRTCLSWQPHGNTGTPRQQYSCREP